MTKYGGPRRRKSDSAFYKFLTPIILVALGGTSGVVANNTVIPPQPAPFTATEAGILEDRILKAMEKIEAKLDRVDERQREMGKKLSILEYNYLREDK